MRHPAPPIRPLILKVAVRAPESTVGQPMAVLRQGMFVEHSVEYSKCHALNNILVSTVDS
eukprot:1196279-Prorocentrum_minimum.AAC.7